ncbi:MAG TPA: hypothetical protein VGO97_05030 [Solirubrobacterales bacterium]|jgi:hypothetical protein|nr:hypothetical protein [Solirubrobacterales bacterium]
MTEAPGTAQSTDKTRSAETGASDLKNAAVLSIGHGVVMALGGVLALLIAHVFGKNDQTDALFTAYGVYGIAVIFGQTLRLTAIPRIVGERDWEVTDRLVAAILAIALLAALPMVAFAGPLGGLLAPNDPGHVAAESLRLLWPAVAGQLVIGLLAAVLVVHGRFNVIGVGYSVSGVMSIAVFLLLHGSIGIKAIPVALDASSLTVAVMFVVSLVRGGWRPRIHDYIDVRAITKDVVELGYASASFVANNLGYVISLAIAARIGAGEATIYAYAYFSAALLVATTAVSAAMARAPGMLEHADPAAAAADNARSGYVFTLVVLAPVFALAAVVGPAVLDFLLGPKFTGGDAGQLVATLFALSGWVLASAAGVFAVVHLLNERRFRALAVIALIQTAILPVMAIAGREIGIEGVAAAQSLSLVVATVAQLRAGFGSETPRILAGIFTATLRAVVVAGIAVIPGIFLVDAAGDGLVALTGAAAVTLLIALGLTRLAWPQQSQVLTRAAAGALGRGRPMPSPAG